MKMKVILFTLLVFAVGFFSFLYNPAYAQTKLQESDKADEQITIEDTNTITALESILQTIEGLQEQIHTENKRLHEAETQEQRAEISKEINKLNERLDSLKQNFDEVATGLDLGAFTETPQKRFDWKEEIQVLIGPIFQELKDITARPRLIENLRAQIAYYEKRIFLIKNALENIHNLTLQTMDENLKKQLSDLKSDWIGKGKQISTQLTTAKYQLADKMTEKKSLVESTQQVVRVFFKSRGRNFVLSILAFFAVFFLLRYIHRNIYKSSAFYKTVGRSFYTRLADVLYHVMTFVGATSALLIVLYTSGDWVLLGLAFIFIFGLIWTAKQTLPRFYEQGTLLMNLGTVKENERVMYNGLPWKVVSLHLYTYLVNPELKGGMIRLPLRELKDMLSRPYHPNEPWFPSKENDWVILEDGTMGQVVIQTPEMVQLILPGGSYKTYPIEEFLKQNPNNLSKNFCVMVTFGIDYQYQTICTTEIPPKLRDAVNAGLIDAGYRDDIIHLNVEFKEIAASSLDYLIFAEFSGRIAKDYYKLSRILQKIALETCNKNGWEIPFTTYTIHTIPSQNDKVGT